LFRAVYATIAAHWFCPPRVSDLEFRAYIQGHFQILNETSDQKRTSMAAQRHYWDYKIENGQGNVDGRLGIKLQDPQVQVLEAFERQLATTEISTHGTKVHLRVFDDDRTILAQIQSRFDLPSRAAANHFVLELAQSLLNAADTTNQTPQQLIAQLTNLSEKPDGEQTDLFGEESPQEPSMNSENYSDRARRSSASPTVERQGTDDQTQLENPEFRGASEQNQRELTTPEELVLPELAADLTTNNDQQLENQAPQTVNHEVIADSAVRRRSTDDQPALFERIEQQQQSMENLTKAIYGLVSVLASSISSKNHNSSSSVGTLNKSQSQESEDGKPTSSLSLSDSSCSSDQSSTTTEKNKSRKRRGELSRQKVNQYIDAIMAYNDVNERPHQDKWLITIAALKRLTHCGQSIIYDLLSERASEIQFHHDQHQLGIFHNQKGRNAQPIESLISLS
jgi:hypothetical protein